MNEKNRYVIILIAIIVVLGAFYATYKFSTNSSTNTGTQTPPTQTTGVTYQNNTYGFQVNLPQSWAGYTIVTSTWSGDSIDANGNMTQGTYTGPYISVRNPAWTAADPHQDIPVYVFTIAQWNDMQADKFHIGAAPINPSELARNSTYVFALPARYNYAYPTGYEEVDQLIQGGAVKAL